MSLDIGSDKEKREIDHESKRKVCITTQQKAAQGPWVTMLGILKPGAGTNEASIDTKELESHERTPTSLQV